MSYRIMLTTGTGGEQILFFNNFPEKLHKELAEQGAKFDKNGNFKKFKVY